MSKLKILKNTIDIIDESVEGIKYSSNFAKESRETEVMIDTYKEHGA